MGVKTPKEMYEARLKLFQDTIDHKKVDKIPTYSNCSQWPYLDAGVDYAKVCRNYSLNKACREVFINKYTFDMTHIGLRNPFAITDSLGHSDAYASNGKENLLNAVVENLLEPEDYGVILHGGLEKVTQQRDTSSAEVLEVEASGNFEKVLWEKVLFRKFPEAKHYTPEQFAKATESLIAYDEGKGAIKKMEAEQYGMLSIAEAEFYYFLFCEQLFDYYRGIKGLSIDLRRCPDKVYAVCDYMDDMAVDGAIAGIKNSGKGHNKSVPSDVFTNLLVHTILNRKQFDRIIAKPYSRLYAVCEEYGKSVVSYSEGYWERFADFFGQYKKGTISMFCEQDDIFKLHKVAPNISLWGGIQIDLLGKGTKEQCVELVKRTIDTFGYDGGLILCPNKMICYDYDCIPENLVAVCDFIENYRA